MSAIIGQWLRFTGTYPWTASTMAWIGQIYALAAVYAFARDTVAYLVSTDEPVVMALALAVTGILGASVQIAVARMANGEWAHDHANRVLVTLPEQDVCRWTCRPSDARVKLASRSDPQAELMVCDAWVVSTHDVNDAGTPIRQMLVLDPVRQARAFQSAIPLSY